MPATSNRFKLISTILIIVLGFYIHSKKTVSHPFGMLVAKTPVQTSLLNPAKSFKYKSYQITPLAEYEIEARVLSVHTYWWDEMSDLSPIDFAVGWNHMSDSTYLNRLDISQGNRFYFYTWNQQAPLAQEEIISSSANMHLIPSDDTIKHQLMKIRPGEIALLKGQLIEAINEAGGRLRSSLVRNDTGFGACEVMWVTSVSSHQ